MADREYRPAPNMTEQELVALATQLAAVATGNPQAMLPVRSLHTEFADCLPIISQ